MSKWNLVSLKDIVYNLDNKRVPLNSSQRQLKESKPLYPYIGANNIMGYIDEYIFDEKILCVAEDGGSWGYNQRCAVLYNEKVWVNNHAHVITAKDNLILEYLMYYLNHTDLNLYINGATRGKLTKSSLESIQIPLPPLPQQQKIANILDAADALRQNDKALIAKYDELTQALFLDMFGDPVSNPKSWEKEELGNIAKKITDGEHQNPFLSDTGKHLIMAKDVLDDKVDFSNPRFVSNEDFNKYISKCKPEYGDILLVSRGATVGRCTIVFTEMPFCLMGSVILIKKGDSFSSEFVNSLLKNKRFLTQLTNVSSASAQQAIYISHLKKLKIILPPLDLQNQFAVRVKVIEEQKAIAQKSLEKSEELFNSLLQRAFKGELA